MTANEAALVFEERFPCTHTGKKGEKIVFSVFGFDDVEGTLRGHMVWERLDQKDIQLGAGGSEGAIDLMTNFGAFKPDHARRWLDMTVELLKTGPTHKLDATKVFHPDVLTLKRSTKPSDIKKSLVSKTRMGMMLY